VFGNSYNLNQLNPFEHLATSQQRRTQTHTDIMYRLQHALQLIMRVQRAIINCRPCCNLLISWPLTRWR